MRWHRVLTSRLRCCSVQCWVKKVRLIPMQVGSPTHVARLQPHHLRGGQSGRRKVAPERLLDG